MLNNRKFLIRDTIKKKKTCSTNEKRKKKLKEKNNFKEIN